jgi:UDP-N-acetylglucosamine 2-epimerase (non-hydrolysing)
VCFSSFISIFAMSIVRFSCLFCNTKISEKSEMAKNNFYTIMNICIFVGARPNFIKVAPILRAMDAAGVDHSLVYAGREDDPTLEASLFDDLQMSRPDVYLGVDCENLNELTGQVMSAFERYLQENKTDTVIVVDDLASTMAAAIVTKKQGIRLAHLVAGTRSFDINMPKEINRLVIDGLSDLLFTAGIGVDLTLFWNKKRL